MVKKLLKRTSLYIYLKYLRRRYLPSLPEREESRMVPQRLSFYGNLLTPGDLCFDVGANIGNRTEIFLKLGAHVIAVEPQHDCSRMLRFRFGEKIQIVQAALGESKKEGRIFISDTSEISSLSREWIDSVSTSRFKDNQWNTSQVVKIITLDDLIEEFGLPQFCKIDVEGYEEQVLKGLTKAIPMISFEYTLPERSDSVSNCLKKLETLGDFECNYTVGEKMEFESRVWLPGAELIARLNQIAVEGLFGDIYIKFKK